MTAGKSAGGQRGGEEGSQGFRQSPNVSKRHAKWGPSLQAWHRGDRWTANPKARGDAAGKPVPTPTLSAALGGFRVPVKNSWKNSGVGGISNHA